MPSFDIVSETNMNEVDNALQSLMREIGQRYDFKGSTCSAERNEQEITLVAEDDYKLTTLQEQLKVHATRRKVDTQAFEFCEAEKASGNTLRQLVQVKQGIDSETAKKIVKEIKGTKIKVQAAIRGDTLRVDGKKRDDLQAVMSTVKEMQLPLPLQFTNFRD